MVSNDFEVAVIVEINILQHPFPIAVTSLLSEAFKPQLHLFFPYHCFLLFYKNQMQDFSVS